jgi:hypothetical protein
MADLKISDMAYRAVQESDMIPVVDSSNLTTNYYALAGMINFQRIFRWNSSAIYLADDLVIYNSELTKGIFRVTATTSPGDAPEWSAGTTKFKSQCLEFVPNTSSFVGQSTLNISYLRTLISTINQPILQGTTYSYGYISNDPIRNKDIVVTLEGGSLLPVICTLYKNSGRDDMFTISIFSPNGNIASGDIRLQITING